MTTVFQMTPAPAKALWFLAALCLLMAVLTLMFGYLAYSARNARFEVSPRGVRLVGDLWGRSIPWEVIDLDGARTLDLRVAPEYRLKRRTMGTGLPGYGAGWFRLRNGEKALAYVTDPSRIAYIPTSDGYSLLLSLEAPDAFLRALNETKPR